MIYVESTPHTDIFIIKISQDVNLDNLDNLDNYQDYQDYYQDYTV